MRRIGASAWVSGLDLLRVADPTRIRVHWLGTPNPAMARATVTFRPTTAQRQWLDRQSKTRGIPVSTLVQLALEQAMQAAPITAQAPDGQA